MKRLALVISLAVMFVLLLSVGIAGAAPAPKVDVCHIDDTGAYIKINISENAFDAHIAHGDASPGDAVPDMAGYEFDDECNAVELWNITGSWDLHFTATVGALGTYDHHMDVVQTDGLVSGTGYYIPAQNFTWIIDSGTVSGNSVHVDLHYTGGHPATWTTTFDATIDESGQLFGIWSDSDGNSGTLTSYTGNAV